MSRCSETQCVSSFLIPVTDILSGQHAGATREVALLHSLPATVSTHKNHALVSPASRICSGQLSVLVRFTFGNLDLYDSGSTTGVALIGQTSQGYVDRYKAFLAEVSYGFVVVWTEGVTDSGL